MAAPGRQVLVLAARLLHVGLEFLFAVICLVLGRPGVIVNLELLEHPIALVLVDRHS